MAFDIEFGEPDGGVLRQKGIESRQLNLVLADHDGRSFQTGRALVAREVIAFIQVRLYLRAS